MDGTGALQELQGVTRTEALPEPATLNALHENAWKEFLAAKVEEPPAIDRNERQFTSFEAAQAFVEAKGQTLDPQFRHLFIQPRYEQRTPEWHNERAKAITASAWGAACGNAEYGNQVEVFRRKTETNGDVIDSDFARICMAHGNKYEDAAAYSFEKATGKVILDFGVLKHWKIWSLRPETISPEDWAVAFNADERPECISTTDWETITDLRWIGGSPDGITADGYVIEIKCPYTQFVDGKIKRMYMWQLLLNMVVAGFTKGYFIQYAPKTELFVAERYDCTEVTLPDDWFEQERPKARVVWDWICEFRKTGRLPEELTSKIRIVEGSENNGTVKFESTRKRKAPSAPRTHRPEPEYEFDDVSGPWSSSTSEPPLAPLAIGSLDPLQTSQQRQQSFIDPASISLVADPAEESD